MLYMLTHDTMIHNRYVTRSNNLILCHVLKMNFILSKKFSARKLTVTGWDWLEWENVEHAKYLHTIWHTQTSLTSLNIVKVDRPTSLANGVG